MSISNVKIPRVLNRGKLVTMFTILSRTSVLVKFR